LEGRGLALAPAVSETAGSRAAEIGRAYDAVPYEAPAAPGLGLPALRGAAMALGFAPSSGAAPDVLDIGCGSGAQLHFAAVQGAGRLVGIDASAEACARAAARGAALGERWRILHGDAAAMQADDLGRFDVVTLIGTLYVMPPPARARVLDLLAACLKPGGVAVVSYYTGIAGMARTRLGAVLRAANSAEWPLDRQIATARANLRAIADAVPAQGVTRELVQATLSGVAAGTDTLLYHEALGPVCDAMHTSELEAALAARGLVFLNYLPPAPLRQGVTSRETAAAADAWDFATGGGYRTALFGRPGEGGTGGIRHPGLVWTTSLKPAPSAPAAFADPATGTGIEAQTPVARAALEALCEAPRDWPALHAATLARLPSLGLAAPDAAQTPALESAIDDLLLTLWGMGVAVPTLE
jgi:SAM-dependent methyltransferase